jgi:multidrug efflux pump subunit AcrB
MRVRWVAFILVVACAGIIFLIGRLLQSELAPMEDRSRLRTSILAPEGTDFDYMDKVVTDVTQRIIDSIPERRVVLSFAPSFGGSGGSNSAMISMGLTDASERKRSQDDIAKQMTILFSRYSNVRIQTVQEQTISVGQGRGAQPVQFVVQHLDFNKLKEAMPKFMDEVSKSPVFQGYDLNLKFNKPELQITIDRT